jgi:hypothetical protein
MSWRRCRPQPALSGFFWTFFGLCLLATIGVLLNVLSFRYHARFDWTKSRIHTLSPKTERFLSQLEMTIQVDMLMAEPERGQSSVYRPMRELLTRAASRSRRLRVRFVDIDVDAQQARLIAKQHDVPRHELRAGVVIVSSAKRRKLLYARRLARHTLIPGGEKRLAFRGEAALLAALINVSQTRRQLVCFSHGHGEAAIDSYAAHGYGYLADSVRRDGFSVKGVGPRALAALAGPVNKASAARCDVLVLGGPTRGFSEPELAGLQAHLRRGGRLLLLLGPVLNRRVTQYSKLGLEPLLARWGVGLPRNILIDPVSIPGEQPLLTWATRQGYGDHPISRALYGRLTLWPLARQTKPLPTAREGLEVRALVKTSARGWAEGDLAGLRQSRLRFDPKVDARGPVTAAVAVRLAKTRLVVIGCDRGLLNRRQQGEVKRDYNIDFFLAALAWAAGHDARVAIGPKQAAQVRLALDDGQLLRVFLLSVVGLPLIALCGGLWVFWRRRR